MFYENERPLRNLAAREEQLKIPEGNFWIGPDLTTFHDITLRPHTSTTVDVKLAPEDLPSDPQLLSQAQMSTRSILMQLGIEVGSETPEVIEATLRDKKNGDSHASIPLSNVGNRAVRIPEGTGIGSLFLWNGKTVENGGLEELISNGDITMTGDRGQDWRYYHDKNGVFAGIHYRLDPDMKMYIPPSEVPIDMAYLTNRHDRPKIDKLLRPVPKTDEKIDWITQTKSAIGLSNRVHALIEPNLNTPFFDAEHRNSLLLKGGDDWPIRLELSSPTIDNAVPEWILFRFAKAGLK
jgi:hypothetical protein